MHLLQIVPRFILEGWEGAAMLTHVNMKKAIDLIVQECRRVRLFYHFVFHHLLLKIILIWPKTMADYARPP
jgi:hypothetical protein